MRARATMARREKKIIKILNASVTVTMHICTITIANVQISTLLEALMWSIFEAKCVKFVSFYIIEDFASTDVDALKVKTRFFSLLVIIDPIHIMTCKVGSHFLIYHVYATEDPKKVGRTLGQR